MKRLHIFSGSDIAIKQRSVDVAKEIFRKSIHMFSALIPLLLKVAYTPVLILLFLALIVYCVSEWARTHGHDIPLISAVTAAAARQRDGDRFVLGPVTLVLGIILSAIIWREDAASAGIFALAFGDGLASLSGKLFGQIKVPLTRGKTVAGSLTCFAAIFITSFLVSGKTWIALCLAGTGMLIELLPLKDFDNVIIPIAIGGMYTLLVP